MLNSWKVGVPNGPSNKSNTVVAVVYPTWGRYTYFSAESKAAGHTKGLCVRLLVSALIVWMKGVEILILLMFREWEKIIRVVQLLIWTRYGSSKAFKVAKSCFALC